MAIKNKKDIPPYPILIDLTGPQGNAFVLLGYAKQFARQLKLEDAEMRKIVTEMQESDYEHLVQTFDKYFGDYVILER